MVRASGKCVVGRDLGRVSRERSCRQSARSSVALSDDTAFGRRLEGLTDNDSSRRLLDFYGGSTERKSAN